MKGDVAGHLTCCRMVGEEIAIDDDDPPRSQGHDTQHSMIILGINAHHADAAAAILVDGKLIAAAEEEFERTQA